MSSSSHNQLLNLLSALSERTAAIHRQLSESETALPVIQENLLQCRSIFQEIVTCLDEISLSPAIERTLRPAQTEAYRLLRLMGVDVMRLLAAKQLETRMILRSQLLAQIERFQGFVQVIADALQSLDQE